MRFLLLFIAFPCFLSAQNQPPALSNLATSVNWATKILTITYDVTDPENDLLDISVAFSDNAGKTYSLTLPATGNIGFPVTSGTGQTITCDVTPLAGSVGAFTVRVVADDKQPFDLQQLVNAVDSLRLKSDLQFIEGVRHRISGLAHLNETRDSLRSLFTSNHLHLEEQIFSYSNTTGRNIIGTVRGTSAAEKVVVVDAHYDTVGNAPGADDNGSGTVGMMEITRLLSRYPTKKTLRFIGFDLEEAGLVGSTQYVSNGIPAGDQIEGVFNFEMIGYYSEAPNSQTLPSGFNLLFPDANAAVVNNQYRGDFITNVGNTNSQPIALIFANAASAYVPDLKVITLNVPGNGQLAPDLLRSDHAPFWVGGYKALMLTDGANFRNECYHTPQDTFENKLNFTFMANVTKATLAAAAQLAEIQHGDWATATFENTVATHDLPAGCTVRLRASSTRSGLYLDIDACDFDFVNIDLYDERGVTVLQTRLEHPASGMTPVQLQQILPAGIYSAQLRLPGGRVVGQQVVVR